MSTEAHGLESTGSHLPFFVGEQTCASTKRDMVGV